MPRASRDTIRRILTEADPALQPMFAQVGHPKRSRYTCVYTALVRSILAQQISLASATAVTNRLWACFSGDTPDPQRLQHWSDEEFRSCGISRQKAGYLRSVATCALAGHLDYAYLRRLDDGAVIEALTRIRGVGRWTAEMILLFPLDRKDVFPVDDIGIQRAASRLLDLSGSGRTLCHALEDRAHRWRPYRSYVTKSLWMWWEDSPGIDW